MNTSRWNLFQNFWKSLDLRQIRLHWLSVGAALSTFVLSMFALWKDSDDGARLIACLAMGISFLLIPSLIFDRPGDEKRLNFARLGFAAVFIGFTLWSRSWTDALFAYKFMHGFLISHLLVSLTPYFQRRFYREKSEQDKHFWSENWFLLNRIHMAATQTIFLTLGTSAALFSLTHLFDIKVDGKVYASFAVFFLVSMSALLFVASLGERKVLIEPAEILKRLVRTVLTPLAVVYLAILYAYALKIGTAAEWPKGGIGSLVSGLALIVTLSYLIMRPLEDSNEFGAKLKLFWRMSFRLLIPPVVLLGLALARRVSEYGWTEERVLLGILALWMLAISIYYWNPNRRSIVAIPLSLAAIFLLTWFGPLSPSFLSKLSQSSRLEKILASDVTRLSEKAVDDARSAFDYLCRHHGPDAVPFANGAASKSKVRATGESAARICNDTIAKAMKQAGLKTKMDEPSLAVKNLELAFFEPTYTKFKGLEYADVSLNTDLASGDDFILTKSGMVTFRLAVKSHKLEWSSTGAVKPVWREISVQPVFDYLKKTEATKTVEPRKEPSLNFEDSNADVQIQFRVVGARFFESDPSKLTWIRLQVLSRKTVQPSP